VSLVVRASMTVTPGMPIIAATIFPGSVSTIGGYVSEPLPPWNPKRRNRPSIRVRSVARQGCALQQGCPNRADYRQVNTCNRVWASGGIGTARSGTSGSARCRPKPAAGVTVTRSVLALSLGLHRLPPWWRQRIGATCCGCLDAVPTAGSRRAST
jgi:hypothetical protein